MHFRYLLSDQHGDIALSEQELGQPFLLSPFEEHPFLTLGDYFSVLQKFIMGDGGRPLSSAFPNIAPGDEISEVIIRSEKHGAFYHIASVEIAGSAGKSKFAVTTAVSENGRESLAEEVGILRGLAKKAAGYLPEIYCAEEVSWETPSGVEHFFMALGEWLEGYHEWHASLEPESQQQGVQLWDYENGYRFLSDAEVHEVLRQAAFILTLCYDHESFRQVYPWHHGAGDFIVNPGPPLSVRLITARQYEPLVYFESAEEADRLVAAIHFLLNLCIRMRLDRFDGVGEPAWLDEFCLAAAVAGFFDSLVEATGQGRLVAGFANDFLEIFRSFTEEELYDMYGSLMAVYSEEDDDDFRLISEKLPGHTEELHRVLQGYSLKE